MIWGLFRIFKASYFPEHLSVVASVGRTSMHNCLSRLEKKLVTMNSHNFWYIYCFFSVFIILLWCMISIVRCFIVIQYGLVMFCSGLRFGVDWVLVLVYWYFILFILEHFVMKSWSFFLLPFYLFGFGLKFVLLAKWESTKGPWRGHGGSHLLAEKMKIGDKDKKQEFQIRNH